MDQVMEDTLRKVPQQLVLLDPMEYGIPMGLRSSQRLPLGLVHLPEEEHNKDLEYPRNIHQSLQMERNTLTTILEEDTVTIPEHLNKYRRCRCQELESGEKRLLRCRGHRKQVDRTLGKTSLVFFNAMRYEG